MDGTMTISEISEDAAIRSNVCDLCGCSAEVSLEPGVFTYGDDSDAVELSATVPVTRCSECGEAYTGEEGEILIHEAVCAHLNRLTPAQITRIRGARTVEELAEEGGFDVDAVRRWEHGNRIQDASSDLVLRGLGECK
jgi:DNA-binding transcriptional regulator YiaG